MRFAIQGQDAYREWKEYIARKEQRQYLYYLKQRKFIEAKKIGERFMVRFTEKGYRQVLRDHVRSIDQKCKDGLCLVIFDIPESQKVVRNVFRDFLYECGFRRLQHSVWVSDREVSVPLLAFVRSAKLTPWVRVIVGRTLN